MQPKRRKVPINFTIDPDVLDMLAEEAERQDRSRSWIVEWAVKKALEPAPPNPSTIPYYVPPPTFGPLPKTEKPLVWLNDPERIFKEPATSTPPGEE